MSVDACGPLKWAENRACQFPELVKPRSAGVMFDIYVSNPDMDQYPFERITVPTLVLHAKDDPLSSFSSVREMAARIPGARLVAFERGGHLLVGNVEQVALEITHFLASTRLSQIVQAPGAHPLLELLIICDGAERMKSTFVALS